MVQDVRWLQRFDNYQKALAHLDAAVMLSQSRELSDIEEQGMIKSFEFTFELAWNVMKDFLTMKGITGIIGSRDSVRQGFSQGLVADGQVWMSMIDSRNESAHTYDETIKNKTVSAIISSYHKAFTDFAAEMQKRSATP